MVWSGHAISYHWFNYSCVLPSLWWIKEWAFPIHGWPFRLPWVSGDSNPGLPKLSAFCAIGKDLCTICSLYGYMRAVEANRHSYTIYRSKERQRQKQKTCTAPRGFTLSKLQLNLFQNLRWLFPLSYTSIPGRMVVTFFKMGPWIRVLSGSHLLLISSQWANTYSC